MRAARKLLTGGGAPGPSRVLALVLLLTCALSAAAPRVLEAFQTRVLRESLAVTPTANQTVSATSGWLLDPADGGPKARSLDAALQLLRGHLTPPLVSPSASQWDSVTTPPLNLLNAARSAMPGSKPPAVEIVYRDPLASHVRVVAGRLPEETTRVRRAGKRIFQLQVAVTTATAARFRLHPGSVLRIGAGSTEQSGYLLMRVTGILQPADPRSAFWTYDTLAAKPALQDVLSVNPGPYYAASVFIGPGELASLGDVFPEQVEAKLLWEYPLRTSALTAAQVPTAQAEMRSLNVSQLGSQTAESALIPEQLVITGNLQTALDAFVKQESTANQILSLTITGMFLIGMMLILLAARLLVERRAEELSALRARGCSQRGLAGRILADTGPLLAVALAAGIAIAVVLVPGASAPASWTVTALLAVAAVGAPPLLAVHRHTDAARIRNAARHDVTIPRRSPRRAVAEVSAVVLTLGVLAALRYRSPGQSTGVNLITGTGPLLVAVVAALIVIRCYPLPLRVALRLAGPRRGAAGYLGLARAARSSATALLPALALILAMSLAGFGGMVQTTVTNARLAASWRQVGADATVSVGDLHPITKAAAARLARTPGARHVVTLSAEEGTLAVGGHEIETTAVDTDPVAYAQLSGDTPGGSFAPSLLAPQAGPIPVLVSAGLAGLAGQTGRISTGVDRPLTVRIAGVLPSTPAVTSGNFLVIPSWAANRGSYGPWPLNKTLLTGSGLDAAALKATARRSLPFAALGFRSAVLNRGALASPLGRAAQQLFVLCLAGAALLAVAAIILGFALAAGSRRQLLLTLTALGLPRRQARRVVLLEALPLLIVAVAGGLLAAAALPMAVGSALNLTIFIGSGGAQSVQLGLLPLALAAGGTALLVILTAVGQTGAAMRGSVASALRKGED
jgi:putative ABC transport system permease protein